MSNKFRTLTPTGYVADKFAFFYPSYVGQKFGLTKMTISRGAAENEGEFAARLSEVAGAVATMLGSRDDTLFAAAETRRAALVDV